MPRRPPSPAGATPGTSPITVFLPVFSSTRVIVPLSREDTSSPPSGSGARPQGVSRSSVTVRRTFTEPLAGGVASADCWEEGDPGSVLLAFGNALPLPDVPPSPEEHPAVTRSAAAANTAVTARRCTIKVPSTRRSYCSYTARDPQVPDHGQAIREAPQSPGTLLSFRTLLRLRVLLGFRIFPSPRTHLSPRTLLSPRIPVPPAAPPPPRGPPPSAAARPRPRSP